MTHRITAPIVAVLLAACGGAIAPEEERYTGAAGASSELVADGGAAGAAPGEARGEGGSAGTAPACVGITGDIHCRGTEGDHPVCRGRVGVSERVCGAEVEFRTAG